MDLVGGDVFAYEDKFGRFLGHQRQLSLLLDIVAAAMWFTVPVISACAIAFVGPLTGGALDGRLSKWAYFLGSASSMTALLYLVGLVFLMRQIGQVSNRQFSVER